MTVLCGTVFSIFVVFGSSVAFRFAQQRKHAQRVDVQRLAAGRVDARGAREKAFGTDTAASDALLVLHHIRAAPAAAAAPAADVITEKPFPQIRKIIAKRLLESLQTSAQYTLMSEADVSGLLALRAKIKAQGEKLGLANINIGDMVMFAVIKALQK